MIKNITFALLICTFICEAQVSEKLDYIPDKSSFTIFNPTPLSYMRDFYTDRPDITESPYTVDAGHIQAEIGLFKKTQSKSTESKEKIIGIGLLNLKLGLTNRSDLEFMFETYNYIQKEILGEENDNVKINNEGIGAAIIRYKYNLWGNDSGKTAFGIISYLQFPSNKNTDNYSWSGGVIFPFSTTVFEEWNLGAQLEIDFNKIKEAEYYTSLLQSISMGRDIYKSLGFFM